MNLGFRFGAVAVAAVFSIMFSVKTKAMQGDADRLKTLQTAYVANKNEKTARAYHFGSQGPGEVFSNHATHTNRLIPVYVFGSKARLGDVIGVNSRYRREEEVRKLYGAVPKNTVNLEAEYADQSDLYKLQADAVARGAKHLFILWFDGMDWDTTRAAAIVKTGKFYSQGIGEGLIFQNDLEGAKLQFGSVVTSPTHDKNKPDVDLQTVAIPPESAAGGYDWRIAGPTPWTAGVLNAPGYLKGQSASPVDRAGVEAVGGVLHAYTDSSASADEFATGQKAFNNGINVLDNGAFTTTLFNTLQKQGWKVGTVTSVPFCHASPAAMYAHNVYRDDYQDIARDMLGLESIAQVDGKEPKHEGLDVVIGTGYGIDEPLDKLAQPQGRDAKGGNVFLTADDRKAIDVKNGGKYRVVEPAPGTRGADALVSAAVEAAENNQRLFGFFGSAKLNHLPYRTADGRYDPAPGSSGKAEVYSPEEVDQQPTLAQATKAALVVLGKDPSKPFALFVEAGDVDFALHDNNLDNAVGAVHSGEEAVKAVVDWVKKYSNWEDSVLIVTADHGHYLVVDDPKTLLPAEK